MTLLSIEDLVVTIGGAKAVDGVSFAVEPGERVGIIGESGSGKTLTALAVMGLLPEGVRSTGSIAFRHRQIHDLTETEMCRIRGNDVSMVFQDPMSSLNPVMRVGRQVAEVYAHHRGLKYRQCREDVSRLFERVGLGDVNGLLARYPYQLSGGQRQRVMLAIALACQPELLIADEPTTALDVTVQKRVLDLVDGLVRDDELALLLISHDLPVVARLCDRVIVMYGGKVMEEGPTRTVLEHPRHPYTRALLQAVPTRDRGTTPRTLPTISGHVPGLGEFPGGCVFRDRCPQAVDKCVESPPIDTGQSAARCWFPLNHPENESSVRVSR